MASGVPPSSVAGTVVLPFNDRASLDELFAGRGADIAAVFVEPVAANMGVVLPEPDFLLDVLRCCETQGAVSVFDEVVTGFRLGAGGAQGTFGLTPDLTMLGKVLGGGLPVGAVGGRASIMDELAPLGGVYQAGTYAAHPHAMAAGLAVLRSLSSEDYAMLERAARLLADGLETTALQAGAPVSVVRAGTFLSVFFAATPPRDFAGAEAADRAAFACFHRAMRDGGVLLPPSPFEVWFPSLAHGQDEIDRTLEVARTAFSVVAAAGG
jgi:glutamate-1-semialdehyde 2,1-aminomutase